MLIKCLKESLHHFAVSGQSATILLVLASSFFLPLKSQSLSNYQQIALENNPELRAHYALFEAALQRIPQVNTLPDPTFSFGYFMIPVETRVGPQKAKLALSQMFPWFGTLKVQGDVATLEAEAKFQSFKNEQNRIKYPNSISIHLLQQTPIVDLLNFASRSSQQQ